MAKKTVHLIWFAMGLLLGCPGEARARAAPAGKDESAVLADLAVKANPGITAVGIGIKALEQRVTAAGVWMDPVFSLNYQNMPVDRWAPGATPMSGIQLSLKQTFYWPGKIAAREQEARARVAEQRQTLAERKVQLRAMVRQVYYRLALVRHLRLVTAEHIKLVDQFIDVVRIKYEVGKVGQHDLLRLQVLRDKLADDLKSFDRDDAALTAVVNAALHRGAGVPIRTPARIKPPRPRADTAALVKAAVDSRPLLRRYLAQAATRRAAANRAAREGYPDISAWFGYTIRTEAGTDPGTDFVTLGLSLPLPLSHDRRWGSMAREAELMGRQAEQAREAELDRIRGDLGRLVAAWKRAVQEAGTYSTKLMPAAHKTLDATFAAYQVYEWDAPWIRLGQKASMELSFEKGRQYRGKVSYIYPTLNLKTRTLTVRLEFVNPQLQLKPGMFTTVWIETRQKSDVLTIPTEAIIHSGERNIVFVAQDEVGKYEPRQVVTGLAGDGHITEIISGLKAGETVVVSGQFLLDSESQLQEALQKLLAARLQVKKGTAGAAASDKAEGGGKAAARQEHRAGQDKVFWTCGMHPQIVEDKPGTCPICGMDLVQKKAK